MYCSLTANTSRYYDNAQTTFQNAPANPTNEFETQM